MNIKLALPVRLILGIMLLAGFMAPPHAISQTQDTSTASLADTLAWLVSFVPTQTGAGTAGAVGLAGSISNINGCNLTLTTRSSDNEQAQSYTFSLSDIDPASVLASQSNSVYMTTRGNSNLIQYRITADGRVLSPSQVNNAAIGVFFDQTSAQRVANAFQHAANLCANASPF